MDKNAIKKYAVWARRELIARVSQRAAMYEITADGYGDQNAVSVLGRVLSDEERAQRSALIQQIKVKGYQQVMEEVAYTWFNRFAALRFMEVNGYLPTRVRVFTDEGNNFKPQILTEAIHMDLDGLDMQKVYDLMNANDDDTLYKYLLITQCNALSAVLPGMFQRISDYTELLFPDNLLREGSVIEQMIAMIPEADWTDQVQIIGWLYQYYNTEPKDKAFADLKKNIKISKENIPAATQLFTPDWIVHYMVENSLGRLWLEGHPNDTLKSEWKYYLDEAEQSPEVQAQLAAIRTEYAALKPEDIRVIDPCCGSGHILCVLFDVLVQIYEDYGYTAREAASMIAENNLWGLDIDERAAQLSYFAVMMKARQYDRRFFTRGVQPHVNAIVESNTVNGDVVDYFVNGNDRIKLLMKGIVDRLHDAKEYGSLINIAPNDYSVLHNRLDEIKREINMFAIEAGRELGPLIDVAESLAQKYHIAVTNPPYAGASGLSDKLNLFLKSNYPSTKSDLFAAFIDKCLHLVVRNGFTSMVTQQAWMFLGSYEKLRKSIYDNNTIENMAHLGNGAFGFADFGLTAFSIRNVFVPNYNGNYKRLTENTDPAWKENAFLSNNYRFKAKVSDFKKIQNMPVSYWISKAMFEVFTNGTELQKFGPVRSGLQTSDNKRFLRLWFEVSYTSIAFDCKSHEESTRRPEKWYPHTKGGEYRKWYGNLEYVLNWQNDGKELYQFAGDLYGSATRIIKSTELYFQPYITWSHTTSKKQFAARDICGGMIFNVESPSLYPKRDGHYFIGLLNSKPATMVFQAQNQTIHFLAGDAAKMPIYYKPSYEIDQIVCSTINLSKMDWDSFETSWSFKKHPLISYARWLPQQIQAEESMGILPLDTLHETYEAWKLAANERFNQLKANEEELNRIFIDIYGLQDELTPDVEEKDVTVRRADLQRDIRSFISYAVGCMFGRYSLDVEGLAYAGGVWDKSKYQTYLPDSDAILPICDDDYFADDIVGRFVQFMETVYGKETLEENLRFIADALGGKGTPRDVIRSYFLNDFYADHLKVYQKRPIYWLFDSGKKNGFKCLIYMHRYQPDTIARIRTDYVHEQQSRYRTAIADLEQRIANAGTAERVKLTKQLTKLKDQAEEVRVYEEKIHHLADQMIPIDLDDGVKVNYAKFADVLAKIK